jgi:UDP-N-acetylglucosamine:LPS N-acetylglucosamine transferase
VILQTGDNSVNNDYRILQREKLKLPKKTSDRFYVTKWITAEEIGYVYNNIDLYVGRAGANTVYEIGLVGIPSIFIPIPWVTHNEQYKNAKVLVDLGLAKILPEGELTAEKLLFTLNKITKKRENMKKTYKSNIKNQKLFSNDGVQKLIKELNL